ncbi:nuclear transport factor 2 family protein [Sphingobium sp. EM0848]|uniref:nuclear transport factor 2 family protein n=1 Tax=Sphingobium sp. EM0848 TaxID=2743473 RepID=UPI00159C2CFB|nr:hypothetical protein [Sphingobium sp. EM0848]
MASNNLSIIESFLKEFGTGSLEKAFSMFTEDAQWSIVQVVRGVTMTMDELQPRLAGMRAALQDNCLHLAIIDVVDGGEKLSIEVESHAKTCLDQIYNNRYCLVFEMSGGKIANVREYNDSLHVVDILAPAVAYHMSQASRPTS